MPMKIVDRIVQMRPEDRARAAQYFMDRAHELMATDFYPEIVPFVDRLVEMAQELWGERS